MKIPLYQIDAFANRVFEGNPAAICPLDAWLDDSILQSIAEENNLSETAYFVPSEQGFHIRWFTPTSEVDLCGHATLATAYVIFNILCYSKNTITFESKSGNLIVSRKGDLIIMDFPAKPPEQCPIPDALIEGLGKKPTAVLSSDDYVAVFETEEDILSISPAFNKLNELELRGIAVTAPGSETDFVSRFFAPKYGINEDPVTGSAHCELAPYWSKRLKKSRLHAKQLSKRGGEIYCEVNGDRVSLSGRAVQFMKGELMIP